MDAKLLNKWHKCKVDIKVLKELSKKSDLKGLQHIFVFFGLLIIAGTFVYLSLGHLVVSILVFSLWKYLQFFKSSLA